LDLKIDVILKQNYLRHIKIALNYILKVVKHWPACRAQYCKAFFSVIYTHMSVNIVKILSGPILYNFLTII
jgi:hypothetical protein